MNRDLLACALALAGCPGGGGYDTIGSNTGTKRPTAGAVGVVSGPGTSGTTATSGTSGSSGTGSSSGNGVSSSGVAGVSGGSGGSSGSCLPFYERPLTDCPDGSYELIGALVDYCQSGAPVQGHPSVTNKLVAGMNATNLSCGQFYFCVAPGQSVQASVTIPNYFPMLVPTVTPTHNDIYDAVPGLFMVCSSATQQFDQELTNPPFDDSKATVLVQVEDNDQTAACTSYGGWEFTLTDMDGGLVSAAVGEVSGTGFDPGASLTQGQGAVLFYNLDSSLLSVNLSGDNPGFDDGGIVCQVISTSQYDMSLSIPLQAEALTFVPFGLN